MESVRSLINIDHAVELARANPLITAAMTGLLLGLPFLLSSKRRTSYKGKTVVITGASAGIGVELAIQYAKLGANLVLAARRVEELNAVRDRCVKLGVRAVSVPTDVGVEADCKRLIEVAVKEFGSVDVLLLNAGVGCLIRADEIKDTAPLHKVFDINFWGYVYPTLAALPHLRKSKGTVVAISSLAAIAPTPRRCIYAATKRGVNAFFDCLRQEEDDVQVTVACPGFVLTEIHDRAYTGAGPLRREHGHFMTAEKCASIIINAAATGKQLEIMTVSGKVAYYLYPFLPKLVQKLAKRKAERSVLVS